MNTNNRDYSTISPSAKSLLYMKGLTSIPYAREVSELMPRDGSELPMLNDQEPVFWGRVVHFENRYWSIDQLLQELPLGNVLELSSGFSFRGLSLVQEQDCHYIDTDLPEVVGVKLKLMEDLMLTAGELTGKLELMGLNAMDDARFREVVGHFGPGPVAIVNEGLLMYLGDDEKRHLCRTIRDVLEERGGCWITADIYIRRELDDPRMQSKDSLNKFFEQHRIREHMFESFEAAEAFFNQEGFIVDREATPDPSKLTGLEYFRKMYSGDELMVMGKAGKMQATWRLKLAGQ